MQTGVIHETPLFLYTLQIKTDNNKNKRFKQLFPQDKAAQTTQQLAEIVQDPLILEPLETRFFAPQPQAQRVLTISKKDTDASAHHTANATRTRSGPIPTQNQKHFAKTQFYVSIPD